MADLTKKHDITEAEADVVERYKDQLGLSEKEAVEQVRSERVGPAAARDDTGPTPTLPQGVDEEAITALVNRRVTELLPRLIREQLTAIKSQDRSSGIADTSEPTGTTAKVHGQPDPTLPEPDPEPEKKK